MRARAALSLLVALAFASALPAAAKDARSTKPGKHLWWNDAEAVKLLSLDAATRKAMDELYRANAVGGTAAMIRGSRGGFKGALMRRDWEDAELELAEIAAPTLREGRIKIEVLKLLSSEQHAILVERMPTVFRRKWQPAPGWAISPPTARKTAPDASAPLGKPDVEGLE